MNANYLKLKESDQIIKSIELTRAIGSQIYSNDFSPFNFKKSEKLQKTTNRRTNEQASATIRSAIQLQ